MHILNGSRGVKYAAGEVWQVPVKDEIFLFYSNCNKHKAVFLQAWLRSTGWICICYLCTTPLKSHLRFFFQVLLYCHVWFCSHQRKVHLWGRWVPNPSTETAARPEPQQSGYTPAARCRTAGGTASWSWPAPEGWSLSQPPLQNIHTHIGSQKHINTLLLGYLSVIVV